jgi:hypothetical protein
VKLFALDLQFSQFLALSYCVLHENRGSRKPLARPQSI